MIETKLDPKEEKQYDQLRRLGQKLHLPIPEHFITLEVFDKSGKLIQRHHQRSHSWTRNAYNLLISQMASVNLTDVGEFGAGKLSIKNWAGAIKDGAQGAQISGTTTNHEDDSTGYRGPAAGTLWGILVGSGVNAEDFEDYVLQTLIAEGTGADQLNYALTDVPIKSWSAPVFSVAWVRYFNNNTVGATSVDVNEVALVTYGKVQNANEKWLNSRDHLASTVTVPSTGQLKVTYTISLTYPS